MASPDAAPTRARPAGRLAGNIVHFARTLRTAGLALDRLDINQVGGSAQVWEKVVRKLRAGMMPPSGMPRPDPTTYAALSGVTWQDRRNRPP